MAWAMGGPRVSRLPGPRLPGARPRGGGQAAARLASPGTTSPTADHRQWLAADAQRVTAPLVFVSGEYPPDVGGVGDYTARLRAALDGLGWPSSVLTRRQGRRWDARALLYLLRAAPRSGIIHIQFQAGAFDLLGDICLFPSLVA